MDVLQKEWRHLFQLTYPNVIFKLFGDLSRLEEWRTGLWRFGVKFHIQKFAHRPDDKKSLMVDKHHRIFGIAHDHPIPLVDLRQNLVKHKFKLFGLARK